MAPSRPQSFSVRCAEGHRLSGVRTEGYQALRCPTCGEGVFVLPRSPLPEPDPGTEPRRTTTRETAAVGDPWTSAPLGDWDEGPIALTDPTEAVLQEENAEVVEGLIEWVDEDAPSDSPAVAPYRPSDPTEFAAEEIESERRKDRAAADATPAKSSIPAKPKQRVRPASSPPRSASRPAVEEETTPRPRFQPTDWVRAHRNPLLFGTVAVIVLLTVGYRNWSAWRRELPGIAERGRTEGLAALEEGRFDAARQLLGPARRAVDVLGRGYDPVAGAAIRQAADEVEILTDLAPSSLEAMLEEATRSDPEVWSRNFDTLYKGRAIILEDQFQEVPDGSGHGRYDLYYRILRPGEGTKPESVGRIDLRGFELIESRQARVEDYVLFGARLASFRFDQDAGHWVVGLVPDSGVVMTHRKALDALNWPVPAESDNGGRP